MSTRAFLSLLCGVGLLVTGCGLGTPGELGNGGFWHRCTGPSDPVCDELDFLFTEEPALALDIAVGSTFSARYEGTKQVAGRVVSASQNLLSGDQGAGFEALRPGRAALLAEAGSSVVDLVHVRLADAARVRIEVQSFDVASAEDVTEVMMSPGDALVLRALPLDEAEVQLGGALPCAWTVGDTEIVQPSADLSDNALGIEARAPGTTTAALTLGNLSAEVTLTVKGDGGGGAGGQGGAGGEGGAGGAGGGP